MGYCVKTSLESLSGSGEREKGLEAEDEVGGEKQKKGNKGGERKEDNVAKCQQLLELGEGYVDGEGEKDTFQAKGWSQQPAPCILTGNCTNSEVVHRKL